MTKEQAKTILQCRGNGYSEDEFNKALEIAYSALDSFLPSNIDDAARKYGHEEPILPEDYNDGDIPLYEKWTADAFKAGAEWMAEQGETFSGFMSVSGKRSLIAIKGSSQNFKFGEDVIVQIRKKQ